jgi:hypothetical protein
MTRLGEAHGVRTASEITAMDTPLGRAAGNTVEVREALGVRTAPAGFDKAVDGLTFMCGRPTAPRRCGMQDRTRSARSKSMDAKEPAAAHSTTVPAITTG